jgi:hypothetical protein
MHGQPTIKILYHSFKSSWLEEMGKNKGGHFTKQCVDERKVIKMCTWLGFVPQSSTQKRLHCAHIPHLSGQYQSYNKQRLLPQTTLTSLS